MGDSVFVVADGGVGCTEGGVGDVLAFLRFALRVWVGSLLLVKWHFA